MARSTEKQRKKCVTLAKKIAVLRDKGICQHCGKRKSDGWQMHGSHIYSEGVYKSMSADVDNILCLCASCHVGGMWHNASKPSWHSDPVYFTDWFKTKYPELAETLKIRAREIKQVNWELKYQELKELHDSMDWWRNAIPAPVSKPTHNQTVCFKQGIKSLPWS